MAEKRGYRTFLGKKKFAQRLSENIRNHSRLLTYPGGNVTMANINHDFAYELIDIFNDTIIDLLLENGGITFDNFGKYEIKTQGSKVICNMFTDNKDMVLPEIKMIRFYPAEKLKRRVRGEPSDQILKRKTNFKFSSEGVSNAPKQAVKKVIEGEEANSGD